MNTKASIIACAAAGILGVLAATPAVAGPNYVIAHQAGTAASLSAVQSAVQSAVRDARDDAARRLHAKPSSDERQPVYGRKPEPR